MYIQLTIQADEYKQDELMALLSDFNPTGFEQKEKELIAFFNADDFTNVEIKKIIKDYTHTVASIEEQNWNTLWESNFQPVVVDDFCAIRADFHQPVKNVQHEVIITPKMSFGTGHHATTYMMIQQMQTINFNNKEVFDFGTGTGILAILAKKLGAASISAIDVDDWSITNAQENIKQNNCSKIKISLSSRIPEQQFDVVLANINRNVLLQYMPQLKKAVKQNGCLLLSGLLTTDEQDIIDACNIEKLILKKRIEKTNWISLLFLSSNSK